MKPLAEAAWHGDESAIRRLIAEGFPVNEQDEHGYTALTYAAHAGRVECVGLLLDLGADPNVHTSYDTFHTPLSVAAHEGHFGVVKALITRGADPSVYAGPWQVRAECYARQAGHHHISEYLEYQCR